jgi:hypothetical protein
MRHFFPLGAVAGLAGRVAESARPLPLIAPTRLPERDAPSTAGAGPRAVALPPVTPTAQEELLLAVGPGTDDQPQRIHALPRRGRGGWTSTLRCAKKGAANVALPRVMSRQRARSGEDSGPSPLSAVAGNGLPQFTTLSNQLAASRS